VGVEAVFPEFVDAPAAVDAAQGLDIFRDRLTPLQLGSSFRSASDLPLVNLRLRRS
jgi:hypothetical protein